MSLNGYSISWSHFPLSLPSYRCQLYTIELFAMESAIPEATISTWITRLKRKQHLIFQVHPELEKHTSLNVSLGFSPAGQMVLLKLYNFIRRMGMKTLCTEYVLSWTAEDR